LSGQKMRRNRTGHCACALFRWP